jgi:HD-GYP domain-containing protein (c-di-GMP phosphodiesterase class II)
VALQVRAAGVGPWDALVRSGQSGLPQPVPVAPGSDVAGLVESVGPGVEELRQGDEVCGATNPPFTGDYAERFVAVAGMLAPRPRTLGFVHAAAVPVVAMGDFADLISPYLVGHSAGTAQLATAAARRCRFGPADLATVRRAAFVHDVGRVAIPVRIWQKPGPLTADEWERVRLHAYHSERVLARSPFLAALAPVATSHHERLYGSGYHRGAAGPALGPPARLLAAADAYHAMTEPRSHRAPLPRDDAAELLVREARAGRLDGDAVAAVLEAAGQRPRESSARPG